MKLLRIAAIALGLAMACGGGSFAASESPTEELESPRFWASALAALISVLGAGLSYGFYKGNQRLSREIADRTVTIESQKLLLEINKQFVSDPGLLAIYSNHHNRDFLLRERQGELPDKIKALGYQMLNVFEIVFTVWPQGRPNKAWMAFFRDSLEKCSVIRDELEENPHLYDERLLAEYRKWKEPDSGIK